jgi:hypothetical protein
MDAETRRREDLKDGAEYMVEKFEEATTRYGEVIIATINYEGLLRKVYMPKYFRLNAEEIERFNGNAWEEKLYIYKKNNVLRLK